MSLSLSSLERRRDLPWANTLVHVAARRGHVDPPAQPLPNEIVSIISVSGLPVLVAPLARPRERLSVVIRSWIERCRRLHEQLPLRVLALLNDELRGAQKEADGNQPTAEDRVADLQPRHVEPAKEYRRRRHEPERRRRSAAGEPQITDRGIMEGRQEAERRPAQHCR